MPAAQSLFATRINQALKVAIEDEMLIVTPSRRLDRFRYDALRIEVGRINDLIAANSDCTVLIDLRNEPALDSITIKALAGFCRAGGGQAAFIGGGRQARRSLKAAGVDRVWPIYADVAEARAKSKGCVIVNEEHLLPRHGAD